MALKERKTNLRDAEVGNCVKFYFFLELDCTKPIARKKCIIRSIVSNLCLFLGKAIILFTILMNRTCTHILQQIQIKACFSNPARRLFFASVYIFFPTIINDLGLVAIVTALHLALPKMGGIIRLIYLIQRRAARRDVMKPPQGWHHLRIDQRSP